MKTFQVTQYGTGSRTIVVEAENESGVRDAVRAAIKAGEDWEYDLDDIHHEDTEEL